MPKTVTHLSRPSTSIPSSHAAIVPTSRISATLSVPSVPSPLAPSTSPRKKLVPKKSRLALLVGSRDRGKENVKRDTHLDAARREDISTDEHLGKIRDVERFANPADDPDIGEIIVVRRKKSRAALDGLQWDAAALTEATNATSAQKEGAPLKVKIEDKDMQKWWSIGRGVKELKEKKSLLGIKSRAKPVTVPEAVDDTTTTPLPPDVLHGNFPIASQVIYIPADPEPVKGTHSNAPARIVPTPEVPPNGNGSGSLAIRAIRSMRSLARMASWATLRGEGEQPAKTQKVKEKKSKESIAKDSATLKKKKREPKENTGNVAEGDGRLTPRASMSNLESSALIHVSGGVKTLGRKKSSFIGLSFGLPSAVRLRQESAAPSAATAASQASVDASRTDRPSTAGSLRPVSIISSECSAHSRTSTGNGVTSNVSVRWDEDALARRRKEKEERKSAESATRGGEERKRVSDRRRRASVTSVFPDEGAHQPAVPVEGRVEDAREPSALTVKRKSRRKPVPEEECERGRPPTIHEGDDTATMNDLAEAIRTIPLDATPRATRTDSSSVSVSDRTGGSRADQMTRSRQRAVPGRTSSSKPRSRSRSKASSTNVEAAQPPFPDPESCPRLPAQLVAPWPTAIAPTMSSTKNSRGITRPQQHSRRTSQPAAPEVVPVAKTLRPSRARPPVVVRSPSALPTPPKTPTKSESSALSSVSSGSRTPTRSRGQLQLRDEEARQARKSRERVRKASEPAGVVVAESRPAATASRSAHLAPSETKASDMDGDISGGMQDVPSLSAGRSQGTEMVDAQTVVDAPVVCASPVGGGEDVDTSWPSERSAVTSIEEAPEVEEPGSLDRQSFIDQLENAFGTLARLDLKYDFGNVPGEAPNALSDVKVVGRESEPKKYSSREITPIENVLPKNVPVSTATSDPKVVVTLAKSDSVGGHQLGSFVKPGPPYGELNRNFRFGGRLATSLTSDDRKQQKPLTLSDIIPPASHVRRLSELSERPREVAQDLLATERNVGGASQRIINRIQTAEGHRRQRDVVLSGLSSSFSGVGSDVSARGPFNEGRSWHEDQRSLGDVSDVMSVDDLSAFLRTKPRRMCVDSDDSSFYFSAAPGGGHAHHHADSGVSAASKPFPLDTLDKHRRDSGGSNQPRAQSCATFESDSHSTAWARRQQGSSVGSILSDFSMVQLSRPCLGDKMLESGLPDGVALAAIETSSVISVPHAQFDEPSYDSLLEKTRRSSISDSLFEKASNCTSMSSESIFGHEEGKMEDESPFLLRNCRPLSILSAHSDQGHHKQDGTMIKMLVGGHVRQQSLDSGIQKSPCLEMGKFTYTYPVAKVEEVGCSIPHCSRPASPKGSIHADGRLESQEDLLESQTIGIPLAVETAGLSSCFDLPSMISPSAPVGRSRSNTCTSTSSTETPPLCAEESDESQASIDLAQLNEILSMTSDTQVPTKTKPRKHRRTRPQTQAINAGVYETIEEELMNSLVSSKDDHSATLRQLPTLSERCRKALQDFDLNSLWNDEQGMVALRKYYALRDEIENAVVESQRIWQDTPFSSFAAQSFDPPTHEDGMRAVLEHSMRNYGPLPSELHPRIRRRSRTHSRPSPYPPRSPKLSICSEQSAVSPQRTPKSSLSPDELRPSLLVPEVRSSPRLSLSSLDRTRISPVKRDGKQRAANAPLKPLLINPNVSTPALDPMKPLSPLVIDVPELKHGFCSAGEPRPRATSTARRTAPGSSKRSTVVSKTSEGKENLNARRGQGTAAAPGESLKINRPRPRGRLTNTSARPIRS